MDSMEMVYYTCLNNDCEKHRNIFVEGDSFHEHCERERLYLEGQRSPALSWRWAAIPLGLAAAVGSAMLVMRIRSKKQFKPPMLRGETETQTWSGAHSHRSDREGHAVPPPIS